jgi:hypothetical protein
VFLIDLFEARSATAMEVLAMYLDRPDMFVTFVDVHKLGINPRSEHTSTPTGIYAYPLREAYAMMENKSVRFGGGRKYICLFEGQGDLLDLSTYGHDDYDYDVETLAGSWTLLDPKNEDFAMSMLASWERDMFIGNDHPGSAIWRLVWRIASRAGRLYHREEMVIANSIYRSLGYSGIVDHGESIIHGHEPAQAVFFSKAACRVVEFLINDHLPAGSTGVFPGRGERKVRGYKAPRDQEDYPINPADPATDPDEW